MKKVIRPFWSYDVQKTEEWLAAMSKQGLHLVKINRLTRQFTFQKGSPKNLTYRIGYAKAPNPLSARLQQEGWKQVSRTGNWYVCVNEQNTIQLFPVRDGVVHHNQKIKYLFWGLFIYLTVIAVFNLFMVGMPLLSDVPVEVEESPWWAVTYTLLTLAIILYVISIYSIRKISTANRLLVATHHEEDRNVQTPLGAKVVKWKPGWMYSPDRLETWLETLEAQGYNLYRVGKTGIVFYFTKGAPRTIRYCADYQNLSSENYFALHLQAGWKRVFTSQSSLQKWTIWSKAYSIDDHRPQLYSDKIHQLKHARKIATAYSVLFVPVVLLYLFLVGVNLGVGTSVNTKLGMINVGLFMLCILIFGSYLVRTWLYYWRLKRVN